MEGKVFRSVECVVRAPEGPRFIHHHHSFLSLLTDIIKETALQKSRSHPNQKNSQEFQVGKGQAFFFPLRIQKTDYKSSFVKEGMRHFTDPKCLSPACFRGERVIIPAIHTTYLLHHMQVSFLCILLLFFFFLPFPPIYSFSMVYNSEMDHRIEFPHSTMQHGIIISHRMKLTTRHLPCNLGFIVPRAVVSAPHLQHSGQVNTSFQNSGQLCLPYKGSPPSYAP